MNKDLFDEIQITAECLFEKEESDRDFEAAAKELASRYPDSGNPEETCVLIKKLLKYCVSDFAFDAWADLKNNLTENLDALIRVVDAMAHVVIVETIVFTV